MSTPLEYVWQSGAWHPLPYYRARAEHEHGEGEVARLERIEHRSQASHNQFFAWIQDIYNTLPEGYRGRWPTPDDLRYWILTYTKFCTREEFVCSSRAEAVRWARNLAGKYHRVEIEGNTLVGYTAVSQSRRSMSKRAFQESKDAVATACAQILGVPVEELQREAGRAA
jgi:hypothetical protein